MGQCVRELPSRPLQRRGRWHLRIPALLFLVSLPGLAPGCAGDRGAGPGLTVRDSSGVRIVQVPESLLDAVPARRLSEPVLVAPAADAPESEGLFRVTAARRLADGTIAVANAGSKEIIVFDAAGRRLRAFGREGAGPGEFRSLAGLWHAAPDSLFAYDQALSRITLLSTSGTVHATLPVPPGDGEGYPVVRDRAPGGSFAVLYVLGYGLGAESGVSDDSVTFARLDAGGEDVSPLGRYLHSQSYVESGANGMFVTGLPFGRADHFALAPSGYYLGRADPLRIDGFEGDGRLRVSIRPVLSPRRVTAEDRARAERDLAGSDAPEARREAARRIAAMPIPGTMPALGRLVVGRDGDLWVQDYPADEEAATRWSVLSPGGEPRGRVVVPPRFEVKEIGSGYVLGVRRDEMDVERVEMYRLEDWTAP